MLVSDSYPLCGNVVPSRIRELVMISHGAFFFDVILDLSKYKHRELVFNSFYKRALRCVMTIMVRIVCKTMERLIKGKIIAHLEDNNLMGDSQHGFRNKRSCLTSLLDFFSRVIDTDDTGNNRAVNLIYLDFQKAFDKVPPERLLVKVMAHASKVMQPDGSETG